MSAAENTQDEYCDWVERVNQEMEKSIQWEDDGQSVEVREPPICVGGEQFCVALMPGLHTPHWDLLSDSLERETQIICMRFGLDDVLDTITPDTVCRADAMAIRQKLLKKIAMIDATSWNSWGDDAEA